MVTPDRFDWHTRYGDLLSPEPKFQKWTQSKCELQFQAQLDEGRQAFYQLARNREPNDCAVRALAVACAAPYERAHWAMQESGWVSGRGASPNQMIGAALMLNCSMVELLKRPGRTLRTAERALKNTHGGFILLTCDHAAGVWNGELIDHARGRLWRVKLVYRVERRK